jgi:hypothetical protein
MGLDIGMHDFGFGQRMQSGRFSEPEFVRFVYIFLALGGYCTYVICSALGNHDWLLISSFGICTVRVYWVGTFGF